MNDEIPLKEWVAKPGVHYITADTTQDIKDEPFTQEDIEYIEREEIPFNIPPDRQLINVGGSNLLAMPIDMDGLIKKIDNIGKPAELVRVVPKTRKQKIMDFLLKPFRRFNVGRN